jgi:hypothetical protein
MKTANSVLTYGYGEVTAREESAAVEGPHPTFLCNECDFLGEEGYILSIAFNRIPSGGRIALPLRLESSLLESCLAWVNEDARPERTTDGFCRWETSPAVPRITAPRRLCTSGESNIPGAQKIGAVAPWRRPRFSSESGLIRLDGRAADRGRSTRDGRWTSRVDEGRSVIPRLPHRRRDAILRAAPSQTDPQWTHSG